MDINRAGRKTQRRMTYCPKVILAILILVSLELTAASVEEDYDYDHYDADEYLTCAETTVGYLCLHCKPGYFREGKYCKRIPACNSNSCFPGVECKIIETPPYYECGECPDGYTGNGKECSDIDECNIGSPCDPRVICHNLSPGFMCDPCPSGFTGSDGYVGIGLEAARSQNQECIDIDECTKSENKSCVENSVCINTEGSYFCGSCKEGYVGDQTVGCKIIPGYCTDGSECDTNAVCIHATGLSSNKCECNTGWAGNGHICGNDSDLDGFPDIDLECTEPQCSKDNCKSIPNSGQEDSDDDGVGDACDDDADNDEVPNKIDNCPLVSNPDQGDTDDDNVGDECDNCPNVTNNQQHDEDGDGIGDACDPDNNNDDDVPRKIYKEVAPWAPWLQGLVNIDRSNMTTSSRHG